MVVNRIEADEKALAAIELVEARLVEAIGQEHLRGLPDLGAKVYGLRVDVEGSSFARLPPKRTCLVLDSTGMLVAATLHGKDVAFVQRAPRGMIRASTFVPYMRAVEAALGLHKRHAERRGEEFRKIALLSSRIAEAMT